MQLVTNKAVETLDIPTTIVQCNHFTKKGDKAELNNYRPISVLTAHSKIIEKSLVLPATLLFREQ